MKRILQIAVAAAAGVIVGCFKDPAANQPAHYLKFTQAFVHLDNQWGSTTGVGIKSDIAWSLSFESPVPDWVKVSKQSGYNSDSLLVTATENNNTAGYKFATVIASPVNDSYVSPVRLTIVQYDSSYHAK